jgi:PAS domain S-box-containing protein
MLPSLPRNVVQFLSLLLFGSGGIILIAGNASIPEVRATGIVLCALAIWIVAISESVMLSKVQTEMQSALEKFSKDREKSIAGHLSKIEMIAKCANPLNSIESACRHIRQNVTFPALVLRTSDLKIIDANPKIHDALGYEEDELIGTNIMTLSQINLGNVVGQRCLGITGESYFSRYAYNSKSGGEVPGLFATHRLLCGSGVIIAFFPDHMCVFSHDEINQIINST